MGVIRLTLPPFGRVAIYRSAGCRRVTARWIEGGNVLRVSVPDCMSWQQIIDTINKMSADIMAIKPKDTGSKYFDGYSFKTDDWQATVRHGRTEPNIITRILPGTEPDSFIIILNSDCSFDDSDACDAIAKMFERIAFFEGRHHLLPYARELAAGLDLRRRPREFKMSTARKRYGSCTASGIINLSHLLMFLPRELRRATILHELAHLEHMDHSPAFYALWDKYLGYSHKKVKELRDKLQLPV